MKEPKVVYHIPPITAGIAADRILVMSLEAHQKRMASMEEHLIRDDVRALVRKGYRLNELTLIRENYFKPSLAQRVRVKPSIALTPRQLNTRTTLRKIMRVGWGRERKLGLL